MTGQSYAALTYAVDEIMAVPGAKISSVLFSPGLAWFTAECVKAPASAVPPPQQRQLVRSQIAQFSDQFDLWNSQNLLGSIKDTWLQESCLDIHFKPGPLHTRGVSYYCDQHSILGIG
jgi:hypothetical protein